MFVFHKGLNTMQYHKGVGTLSYCQTGDDVARHRAYVELGNWCSECLPAQLFINHSG